ncbi:hypothetical protein UMZ34_10435 [Halopseudomonas pachastrellae]|nr:hypothetical protein UMZ34_10435 [Halopseudomonas pachastrellae]
MSPRSPFSALRWLIALLVLGGMLFLLVERAPEQSIPEPVSVPSEAPVATDTASEVFGEPLPALQSLEELDLDTPHAPRLDLQHWQTIRARRCITCRPTSCRCWTCRSCLPPAPAAMANCRVWPVLPTPCSTKAPATWMPAISQQALSAWARSSATARTATWGCSVCAL